MSSSEKVSIARNRKARFEYSVESEVECGIVLSGTEVKSLREGQLQIMDAFAQVDGDEVFIHQLYIPEYAHGNIYNHEPRRKRKLLLHRREIDKISRQVREKGVTLVPLELYWKQGRAKVLMGLCRGKKLYDKRRDIKKRDVQRSIDRGME